MRGSAMLAPPPVAASTADGCGGYSWWLMGETAE